MTVQEKSPWEIKWAETISKIESMILNESMKNNTNKRKSNNRRREE